MRLLSAILIIGVTLAAQSCGGGKDESRTGTGTAAETNSGSGTGTGDETKSAPNEQPPKSGSSQAGFDRSRIQVQFTQRSIFSKARVAYFIASGPVYTHLAQARSCVAELLKKAPSAYCYAFPSQRAFRFARVSGHAPVRMEHQCWTAYWGKPKGRRPIATATNPARADSRCP